VLIADDDDLARHVLRMLLRELEYEVVGEAHDGTGVLNLIDQHEPHVLCLDLNMPRMGGMEVLRMVRQQHPGLVIIIISGASTKDNVREALALGAAGFVVKPFNANKLNELIMQSLSEGMNNRTA
jgi:two-component system chemotaxis response regulator CheY